MGASFVRRAVAYPTAPTHGCCQSVPITVYRTFDGITVNYIAAGNGRTVIIERGDKFTDVVEKIFASRKKSGSEK